MEWQYGSTEYTLSTYPKENEDYGLIVFTSGQVLGLSDADNFSINAPVSIVDPNHVSEDQLWRIDPLNDAKKIFQTGGGYTKHKRINI